MRLDNATLLAKNFEHYLACVFRGAGDLAATKTAAKMGVKYEGWSPMVEEATNCVLPQQKQLTDALRKGTDPRSQRLFELVSKAAVAAGTLTDSVWAGPLQALQTLATAWFASLRNSSALDALAEFWLPVPSGTKLAIQALTGGSGANTAEASWKPITSFSYSGSTTEPVKSSGIIVFSDSLLRFGGDLFANAIGTAMRNAVSIAADEKVFDILLADKSFTASSGNPRTDVRTLRAAVPAGQTSKLIGFAAPDALAQMALAGGTSDQGPPMFPDLAAVSGGGSIAGIPFLPIDALHDWAGSPSLGDLMVLVDASQLAGSTGTLEVEAFREGSVAMLDSVSPGGQSMVNLFQTNSIAVRAERWFVLDRSRATAVAAISNVSYTP